MSVRTAAGALLLALITAACGNGGGGTNTAAQSPPPAESGNGAPPSGQPCELIDDADIESAFGEAPTGENGGDGNCEWTLSSGATIDAEITGYGGGGATQVFGTVAGSGEAVDVGERGSYDGDAKSLFFVQGDFLVNVIVEGETPGDARDGILALGRVLATKLAG